MNIQEIDVYVTMEEGLFLYDAKAHQLTPVVKADLRALTGKQPFVKDAPLTLVYVADYSLMDKVQADTRDMYAAIDTGFIGQNVYLYCASEGLAVVLRAFIDKPALEKAMQLRPDQKVIVAQTVGYPKK